VEKDKTSQPQQKTPKQEPSTHSTDGVGRLLSKVRAALGEPEEVSADTPALGCRPPAQGEGTCPAPAGTHACLPQKLQNNSNK